MIRACVLGDPVAHSLSPALHGWWLARHGIDGHYGMMQAPREKLQDALDMLRDGGYAGCNLTLPLKEDALALMDRLDDSARAAGAVNTVVIRDGRFHGYNSDGFGFVASLDAQAPQWKKSHVVILGAGGAARGIVAALKAAGVEHVALVNRTPEKAGRLARDLGVAATTYEWQDIDAALNGADLLVNCTSLGMRGQPPLDISLAGLPQGAVVADIVYRPLQTSLLKAATASGRRTVEGLSMLLHQGRIGFHAWFGVMPDVTPELHAYMRQKTEEEE